MTSLYRRYRSATFGDLIGQEHIARTLRSEVRHDRLAHAYLFTGIRGTGKTSTARILARAVNCLNLSDGEPCNECRACVEVTGGSAVDVLEIDAASNRGIDEMRDLREKVKFMPASLRRKVYIIDEAHMLTPEAWNAFLKTLEEPPSHVLFVLCTTEPHKVPETVRSRVQRFDFRRVGATALRDHLASIAASEDVEVDVETTELIARAAQGSVRDALSLLDQALAVGDRPVTAEVARQALGLADPATLRDLLLGLGGRDAATALRAAAAAFDAGADPRQFLREAGRFARAAELIAVGYTEGAGLSGDDGVLAQQLAAMTPSGFWLRALENLSATELELRQPVDARLQVEACLLRLCRDETAALGALEARISVLEGGRREGGAGAVAPQAAVAAPPRAPGPSPADAPAPAAVSAPPPTAAAEAKEASTSAVTEAADTPTTAIGGLETREAWDANWKVLVEAVNRRDAMLAGILRGCRALEASATELVVGAPGEFHLDRLRDPVKARLLADAVAAVAGGPRAIRAELLGAPEGRGGAQPAGEDTTQAVLTAFAGSRVTATRLHDHTQDEAADDGSPG